MVETTEQVEPQDRTPEQVEADKAWLAQLRAARFEKTAGVYGGNLDYEQKGWS